MQYMTDYEAPPNDECQNRSQNGSCASMIVGERLLPEAPIGRQKSQADCDEMFLQLEQAVGYVEIQFLQYDSNADPISRIDNSAQYRGGDIKDNDCVYIRRGRDRAEAPYERTGHSTLRQPNTDRLMGNRAEQSDSQDRVNDEQRGGHEVFCTGDPTISSSVASRSK